MKGYVYALEDLPEDLQSIRIHLGEPLVHWVADGAELRIGIGIPTDWKDRGAVFGPRGELRWWTEGHQRRALLLTDQPAEKLRPVGGDWTIEPKEVELQNVEEPRVKPNFEVYPHGSTKGRLEVRIYYRNGVPVFISPRQLKK